MIKPLILATILVGIAAVISSANAAVVCRDGLNATHCQDGRDRYTIRRGLNSTTIEKNGRRVATCRQGLVSTRRERR